MGAIDGKTRLVGVMGWPVAHTLSPAMHNAAIRKLGLHWVYVPLPVAPEKLAEALAGARAMGFAGVNLTIPHKEAVLPLLDGVDTTARAIGAVNTVHFREDGAHGFNTDAEGYVRTVEVEGGFSFKGSAVLQIGAGGAGRGMAAGAAAAGAKRIMLHNRTAERALALAKEMSLAFPKTKFEVVESETGLARAALEADLIANASSLGLKPGDALPLPAPLLAARHVVFDTVYVPAETPLLAAARAAGARCVPGLGMLARQGAAALRIWSGQEPDEALMLETLMRKLKITSD